MVSFADELDSSLVLANMQFKIRAKDQYKAVTVTSPPSRRRSTVPGRVAAASTSSGSATRLWLQVVHCMSSVRDYTTTLHDHHDASDVHHLWPSQLP